MKNGRPTSSNSHGVKLGAKRAKRIAGKLNGGGDTNGAGDRVESSGVGRSIPVEDRGRRITAGSVVGSVIDSVIERSDRPVDSGDYGSGGRGRSGDGDGFGNGADSAGGRDVASGAGAGAGAVDVGAGLRQVERDVVVEPKPKRTRRRRTGSDKTETAQDEAAKQIEIATHAGLTGVVLSTAFYAVSKFRGPHWKLEGDELMDLSYKLTVAIDCALPEAYLSKYNEILEKFAPVTAAAIAAIGVIAKRITEDKTYSAPRTGIPYPSIVDDGARNQESVAGGNGGGVAVN